MTPIKIILKTDGEDHFYKGFLKKNINEITIQYLDENLDIVNINISNKEIEIKRSNSLMKFNKEMDWDFSFETEFGKLIFRIVTNSIEIGEQYFHIEYCLYDEFDNLANINKLSLEYIKE